MLNRAEAPPIKDAVDFDLQLPMSQKHTLSNGVEVYAIDMGTEEAMMINWVFFAGNWYEPKKLVGSAANYLLKNGTTNKSAFQINEHFEYFGSYLNRSCYSETAELVLHCLSKHVQELLPVVAELISDSVFSEEELSTFKRNSIQKLTVGLRKSEFVASRLIDAYMFGENHPYGKYSMPEDYEALDREQILNFYEQYYKQGRCVIFVSGKLPADIIQQLESSFGKLPLKSHRSENTIIEHPLQPATEKKYRITNDPDGVQAAIRIMSPFPNRHHPDFQKANVLNNLFGGFFGSRLMTNIREDKGYTYGIHSYLLNFIHNSGWMISTEAGRDVAEATIDEIYKEMFILRDEEIDEEELLMTRNSMIGSILGDLDGPFHVAARWKSMILNNLTPDYFYDSIKIIKTVSAEELKALANKYLQPTEFYELVVI
ncbi:MAG TPA: pitrilysin family protein [Flavitalea sp.]|nr:pitrilysin family protein [Flavitalea sp.]